MTKKRLWPFTESRGRRCVPRLLQVVLLDREVVGFVKPEAPSFADENPGTPHETILIVCCDGLVIVSVSKLDHDLAWLVVDQSMDRGLPDVCAFRAFELHHGAPDFKLFPRARFLEVDGSLAKDGEDVCIEENPARHLRFGSERAIA